jgi:hypothetical protein
MAFFAMTALGTSTTVSSYAQRVLGYSPTRFGLAVLVMTLMTLAGAYAGQAGVTRAGFRPVAAAAMMLMGLGAFLLSRVPVHGTYFGDLFPPGPAGLRPRARRGPGRGGLRGDVFCGAADGGRGLRRHERGLPDRRRTGDRIVSGVVASRASDLPGPAGLTEGFRAGFTTTLVIALAGLGVALLLLSPLTSDTRDKTPAAPRTGQPERSPTHNDMP